MDLQAIKIGFEQEAWERLKAHRASAASFKLDVLIWGPSDDGSPEYEARCKIRDRLRKCGHNADFSEDLCDSPEALLDPLHDEFLQAEAADAIIMIYGTRGTQTEIDKILNDQLIALKAYVLIEEQVHSTVHTSVSSESWKRMALNAKVIVYKGQGSILGKVDEVCAEIEKLRKERYVKELRRNRRS